jgi:predicted Zn-dependent protease
VKERILQTLRDLRAYALNKGYEIDLFYHEENSSLIRFANSAISLNTNEHLIRLAITAYTGKKRASYALITSLDQLDEMKHGMDTAAEMVKHTQSLTYQSSIPEFRASFEDESGYDAALGEIDNEDRLAYFFQAVKGLEMDEIRFSGIFSSGANTIALISTREEHTQYFKTSDAQVVTVLSHNRLKWEVRAAQSAYKKDTLDAELLQRELAFLSAHYQADSPQQLPLGSYDVVFGPAATADLIDFMNYVAFDGGNMKRGFAFLSEKEVGQKVLSARFNLTDDPTGLETFPYRRDFYGIPRQPFPLFQNGIFQGFTWNQEDADEFGETATGHSVDHISLTVGTGDRVVDSLEGLLSQPRDKDVLYIPYLHYMNIVNPSKGIITGSSRFGAMLLKRDGGVTIPYNVRLTLSLLELFGDKIAWLSRASVVYNVSHSYGARNPRAIVVPAFLRVNDLEISHSNASY